MKKTKELIKENLKLVDVVLEILDARVPISSQNHDLLELVKNKNRIVIINKADLVEKRELDKITEKMRNEKFEVLEISALKNLNIDKLKTSLNKLREKKTIRLKKKGIIKSTLRVMIIGIPNVGKSMLINCLAKRKAANVANVPGFTKGKQWIKIGKNIELLDTPGILWPNISDIEIGYKLAIINAIKIEILDEEDLAKKLITILINKNSKSLKSKYGLSDDILKSENLNDILEQIAKKLNFVNKDSKYDFSKTCKMILKDFREKKLGNILLD